MGAQFGTGVFSIQETALYLGLSNRKVKRWINDIWNTRIELDDKEVYSWGEGKSQSLNFLTLIEFYTFYQLRNHSISVGKILTAHKVIRETLHTPYPFASSKILTDGCKVFFEENHSIIDAEPGLQMNIEGIILPFCTRIEFGSDSLAKRFWPKGTNVDVVIDPSHQFGQPTIPNTNILARQLFNLYKGGESPEFIAALYGITEKHVNDAIFMFN